MVYYLVREEKRRLIKCTPDCIQAKGSFANNTQSVIVLENIETSNNCSICKYKPSFTQNRNTNYL